MENSNGGEDTDPVTIPVQVPMEKISLKLMRNVKHTDSRAIIVGGTASTGMFTSLLMEVQQAAANKMRISLANLRLFNVRGEELSVADQDHAEKQIRSGGTLYVSAGEPCVMDKVPSLSAEQQLGNLETGAEVVVLAKESFVDAQALKQLKWAASLPGVVLGVGLPDLHVGAGCPIGATIASEGIIYPTLVGSDIGCGMLLAKTSLKAWAGKKERNVERWAANLQLEGPWSGDAAGALAAAGVQTTPFDDSLGTVGRGNHFAELQVVESIEDVELAQKIGLSTEEVYLCVHSGSRGYGESILKTHTENITGSEGMPVDSQGALDYLAAHDRACKWAQVNRLVISTRLLEQLNASCTNVLLDITHNSVVEVLPYSPDVENPDPKFGTKSLWLHRKGAAPLDQGPVVIPGSRGAFSYLVEPSKDVEFAKSGWSLAHGAGRVLARSAARTSGKARHPNSSDLTTTSLGSRVVCDDKALLYEERPEAYKDAACVVADLVSANLCTVVALLRPVLTYKMKARPDYKTMAKTVSKQNHRKS